MRRLTAIGAACVLILLAAGAARAQTIPAAVNPTTVQFPPSADQTVLGLDGVALVTKYELRMFLEADQATPISVTDLGKPTPGTDGTITVTNPVWFAGLTKNTRYVARVAAIGPTGEGVSAASNPFGMQGPPRAGGAPQVLKK